MNLESKKSKSSFFYQLFAVCALFLFFAFGCAKTTPPPSTSPGYPKPYKVGKNWYKPIPHARGFSQKGIASWYGKKFHGRKTANGEIYNMYAMTAAHKTLPLGTHVRVKNLNNKKEIEVRINDRGPFIRGRIIDLSYTAAKKLEIVGPGTAPVKIVALGKKVQAKKKIQGALSYAPVDYFTGNFTIQVGAFNDRNNALKLKQKLDQKYKNAHIATYNRGDGIFYRVRVGRCSTLEKAEAYEKILINSGFKGAIIVAE